MPRFSHLGLWPNTLGSYSQTVVPRWFKVLLIWERAHQLVVFYIRKKWIEVGVNSSSRSFLMIPMCFYSFYWSKLLGYSWTKSTLASPWSTCMTCSCDEPSMTCCPSILYYTWLLHLGSREHLGMVFFGHVWDPWCRAEVLFIHVQCATWCWLITSR